MDCGTTEPSTRSPPVSCFQVFVETRCLQSQATRETVPSHITHTHGKKNNAIHAQKLHRRECIVQTLRRKESLLTKYQQFSEEVDNIKYGFQKDEEAGCHHEDLCLSLAAGGWLCWSLMFQQFTAGTKHRLLAYPVTSMQWLLCDGRNRPAAPPADAPGCSALASWSMRRGQDRIAGTALGIALADCCPSSMPMRRNTPSSPSTRVRRARGDVRSCRCLLPLSGVDRVSGDSGAALSSRQRFVGLVAAVEVDTLPAAPSASEHWKTLPDM